MPIVALALVAALALACSSGSGGGTPDAVTDTPASDPGTADGTPADGVATAAFAAVSFNTGLAAGYVDYAAERLPLIGPAVAALDADVVCLQEVWNLDAVDAIVTAVKTAFPYEYHEVTKDEAGGGAAACTVADVTPLKSCVEKNCAAIPPGELATCALANCGTEFKALPGDCSTCIVSNIGKAIDEILTTCTTSSGGKFAYEGRNGVVLLSRHPLSGTEMLKLDSYANVRVVLHAVADVPSYGKVDVFCTHLTADLAPDVQYAGTFKDWGEEQGKQIDAMLAWIGQKAGGNVATVLAGDLNCGPAKGADIQAVHAENYQKLKDAGLADPFVDDAATPCSWCASNPLVHDGKSMDIDHVLVKQAPTGTTYQASRVLDGAVTVTSEAKSIETRLSDHFGVRVKLAK